MSGIKEAYGALQDALVKETGMVPTVAISFHTQDNPKIRRNTALEAALTLAAALETEPPHFVKFEGGEVYTVGLWNAVYINQEEGVVKNADQSA